jgi:glycosyltransferase involved in cell wall biosynthesis
MEQAGAVFHHFAYVTEEQLSFKERYYGYKGAVAQWRALQAHQGSDLLKKFFGWVTDNTMFDDAAYYLIDPIVGLDPSCGSIDDAKSQSARRCKTAVQRPRFLVDGIIWQYNSSGVARLWKNVLREWVESRFADNVILLDRGGTAPRIPGVHYQTIAGHDFEQTGHDSLYLESICRRLDADAFVSTYYSTPTTTPSFFMGYDMIPEVLGLPLDHEEWRSKHRAILHASAHGMISRNSANDLEKTYPLVVSSCKYVMHCGVDPNFSRPTNDDITSFCNRYGLDRGAFVLMVGHRVGYEGYKNGSLAFRALALLLEENPLVLICVGGPRDIEPQLRELAPRLNVRHLTLDDADLRMAYAGAHALLYPSKYEGFGMPPLESMACGTPAIVCRNSSLPEVVGEAALYVDENDPTDMANAILRLYDRNVRTGLVSLGLRQAARFTFARMAKGMAQALIETYDRLCVGDLAYPNEAWSELRRFQQCSQTQDIMLRTIQAELDTLRTNAATRVELDRSLRTNTATRVELDQALETIASIRNSPFWRARERAVGLLRKTGLRRRA